MIFIYLLILINLLIIKSGCLSVCVSDQMFLRPWNVPEACFQCFHVLSALGDTSINLVIPLRSFSRDGAGSVSETKYTQIKMHIFLVKVKLWI